MKNNPLVEKIIREANIYEQYCGVKPQQVHLSSGLYFLYWDRYDDSLLCVMNAIEEEIALGYARNDS